jgi:hypothetical protein
MAMLAMTILVRFWVLFWAIAIAIAIGPSARTSRSIMRHYTAAWPVVWSGPCMARFMFMCLSLNRNRAYCTLQTRTWPLAITMRMVARIFFPLQT